MLDQVATQILPINLKELKRLGIDEISLVKGQGEFIVVLVDLDARNLKQVKIQEKELSNLQIGW